MNLNKWKGIIIFIFTILVGICFYFCFINNNNLTKQSDYLIYNPYKNVDFSNVNHFKANLHTHTTESDGSSSPSDVIYQYANVGNYDILAITDHNLNTWPWSDWISEKPDLTSSSSEYYSNLDILAISANEPSVSHHHGSFLSDYLGNGSNLEDTFQYYINHNNLSIFYHPGRYNYEVDWYNNYYDKYNIIGQEAYNQGDKYSKGRELWDKINSQRSPDKLIWGFSNDDMHNVSSHAFRNYQHFLMNSLEEEEFRKAMINGAFYSSYEYDGANSLSSSYGQAKTPILTDVAITDSIIQISGENYDSIKWYDNTTNIVGDGNFIDVSNIDSNFVRAVLENSYGLTYTQPFGYEQISL